MVMLKIIFCLVVTVSSFARSKHVSVLEDQDEAIEVEWFRLCGFSMLRDDGGL